MKWICPASSTKFFFAAACLILALATRGLAQPNLVPVVTVQATQPIASVTNFGVFTLFRSGDTNATLNVWYDLGGTASNGVDYVTIPQHSVTIPAGATSKTIVIAPLLYSPGSNLTKSIVLQLAPPPTLNPVNFEIGVPSNAVMNVESYSQPPPSPKVTLFNPTNGSVFYTPANILISAAVSPSLGNVEFFAGTNDLGSGIPYLSGGFIVTYYNLTWTNPPPGDYALTAVVDFGGPISVTSAPVNITVDVGIQPTNHVPTVAIVSPTNGATFRAPTNILISAAVSPSLGNVEFFAGTNDLGSGIPYLSGGIIVTYYNLTWTNPPPGDYALTAVVSFGGPVSVTSAPVNITVDVGIQPTNRLPAVAIVSPTNGATFRAPTNISISAAASPSLGNVEFFAGTNDLGSGIPYLSGGIIVTYYNLTWTNPPPGNYALTAVFGGGLVSVTSAPVNITVDVRITPTNRLPAVAIVSPTNGATFYASANIPLIAKANDLDGSVTNLEFFANGADLGRGLPVVLDPPGLDGVTGLVYFLDWHSVPANYYSLTAVATDSVGGATTSAPVAITVQLPPTNIPPVVRIINPPKGTIFFAPVDVPLYAYAAPGSFWDNALSGGVTNLEFYADGMDIGDGHHVVSGPSPAPYGGAMPQYVALLPTHFFLLWSNAPIGLHRVTAVAADYFGNSATSAPVDITVAISPPAPTNRPAIVSIVTTDPIAVEGTNSWVWPGETNSTPSWTNWPVAVCRLFTNYGPKTATFSVSRWGDTNGELDVAYAVGGTATNGIDYVALTGVVAIAAGERRADITIVPLDDGPPDITSTVVLKLAPDATGTNYLLGYPRAAAAIIVDSESPRAATGIVPGGVFHLAGAGPDGAWFRVEWSIDLVHWTAICTNQVVNGSIDFVDPDTGASPARFYRTVPEVGPPTQ